MKRLLALILCLLFVFPAVVAEEAETGYEFTLRHANRDEKRIAITVDDCYNLKNVAAIFDLCKEYNIPMTFFVCGTAMMVEHRDLWTSIIDFGCEIGNHTYGHKNMAEATDTSLRFQILRNQQALDTVLGYHYEMQVFRPPYGKYNRYVTAALEEYGYLHNVLWDVDTTKYKTAYNNTQNGSILIYHANKADVNCLTKLIPMLVEDGYEFCTVSGLLGLGPIKTSELLYTYDKKTKTLILRPDDEQPSLQKQEAETNTEE